MGEPLETGWLPSTPVGDTVVRRFLHSQALVCEAWAAGHPDGRAARTDALALADPGGPVPWNYEALLQRPLTGLDDPALDDAESFLDADASRPSVLLSAWPTPDLAPRGWHLLGHPALVCRAPAPVPPAGASGPPPGVEVVEVTTPDRLAEAERVVVDGYPLPWASGAPTGSSFPPGVLGGPLRVRLALVDGEPAAVGVVLVDDEAGVVNLCFGATMPVARRRGAWSSLVWARVGDAPQHPAVAFTSDDSRPGFAALGFLVLLRLTLWGRGDWG